MKDTMRGSSEIQAEGRRSSREARDRTAQALAGGPQRLNDGSIDHKARAQRLRHEFIVDVKLSLARQALRGVLLLAQRIAAPSHGALEIRTVMRDVSARDLSEERFRRML
jgi:hypothetical protein